MQVNTRKFLRASLFKTHLSFYSLRNILSPFPTSFVGHNSQNFCAETVACYWLSVLTVFVLTRGWRSKRQFPDYSHIMKRRLFPNSFEILFRLQNVWLKKSYATLARVIRTRHEIPQRSCVKAWIVDRPFATNDHMVHGSGKADYYSRTGTLKQRDLNQWSLTCLCFDVPVRE